MRARNGGEGPKGQREGQSWMDGCHVAQEAAPEPIKLADFMQQHLGVWGGLDWQQHDATFGDFFFFNQFGLP